MAPTVAAPIPTEADDRTFFCTHCGTRSEFGSIFCRRCGAALVPPVSLTKTHEQPESSVLQVRPWVRYRARMFDLSLYAIVVGMLLAMYFPTIILEKISNFEFSMLLLSSWVFVESILLSAVGTTPGKGLLKIRLQLPGSNSIPFLNAFYRSLKVWFLGFGLGFPFIAVFTLWHAESLLTRDSITSWDREGGFVVRHERIGAARGLFAAAFFVFFYGFTILETITEVSKR